MNSIKETMEQSRNRHPVDLKKSLIFGDIHGNVSSKALDLVKQELSRGKYEVIVDETNCGYYYRRTHGVPCCHEFSFNELSGGCIQLSAFHDFWNNLDIEIDNSSVDPCIRNNDFEHVWDELQKTPSSIQK
ncbi:hypothetical protein LIER_10620 [Lithospermum erythrorhizon]|uniref:Uncharacterized protein n=1 Tax=Lithospermum erythrorhizon TaxID=34254 RepID=A0AAV3PLP9_LITER